MSNQTGARMLRERLTTLHRRVFSILLVCLFFCGNAQAANYPEEALTGLDGIKVVIASIGEDAKKAGLTQERLETIVALRLLKAGVPVLKFFGTQKGNPFLFIDVSALKIKDEPVFCYLVAVSLSQNVLIQRAAPLSDGHPTEFKSAITGANSTMGYAGRNVFVSVVTNVVEELVDEFALEYLKNRELEKLLADIEEHAKTAPREPTDPEKPVAGQDASPKSVATQPATNPTPPLTTSPAEQ